MFYIYALEYKTMNAFGILPSVNFLLIGSCDEDGFINLLLDVVYTDSKLLEIK